MTITEVAEMLGVKASQVYNYTEHRKISPQAFVDMVRDGRIVLGEHGRLYPVEGKMLSVRMAAEMLGVKPAALVTWRHRNRDAEGRLGTLEDAVRHFREYPPNGKRKPRASRRHAVGQELLTVAEAAERMGVKKGRLYGLMHRNRCTLAEAMKRIDRQQVRAGAAKIMAIIRGED